MLILLLLHPADAAAADAGTADAPTPSCHSFSSSHFQSKLTGQHTKNTTILNIIHGDYYPTVPLRKIQLKFVSQLLQINKAVII